MLPTSLSLLDRLREPTDRAAWQRLQDLYTPLIRHWLGRVPGLGTDLEDLTQEVMVVLVREVGGFQRQREGSFRSWLRNITVNRLREYARQSERRPKTPGGAFDAILAQLADPTADLARTWEADHDRHVFGKLLEAIAGDFQSATWAAFQQVTFEGRPVAAVAADLGMSENAVLLAKSRVLKRLREEAAGLID